MDIIGDSDTHETISPIHELTFVAEDASAPTLDFQSEIRDSEGNLLRPGHFYLNIGYDAESGFTSHYIPISSTELTDEQQLRSIYFNDGEEDESSLLHEHTYSTNSHHVLRENGGVGERLDSSSTSLFQENKGQSHTSAKSNSNSNPTKRKSKSRDDGRVWDSNRTITLLQLMREHEEDFKQQVSRQRFEVWDAIAEEMRKFGYIDATRLSCAKKWYNTKKKYQQLSGLKSKEKKWYCHKHVKYLIPVMKRSRQLPFTHHLTPPSNPSSTTSTSVKKFMEQICAQNQRISETLEAFRIEKEILNQEQEIYLEEIKKSLQERSERLHSSNHEAALISSSTAVIRSCDEIRNLLPIENCMEEMVELVDGENIIQTTSTTGEPIQLTVCLDWNQLRLDFDFDSINR